MRDKEKADMRVAKEREKELARLEAERRKHFERVQKEQASWRPCPHILCSTWFVPQAL